MSSVGRVHLIQVPGREPEIRIVKKCDDCLALLPMAGTGHADWACIKIPAYIFDPKQFHPYCPLPEGHLQKMTQYKMVADDSVDREPVAVRWTIYWDVPIEGRKDEEKK